MRKILFFVFIFACFGLFAQEEPGKFSLDVSVSGNIFQYGEKGFGIYDGISYRISPNFKISPAMMFGYGYYRYSQNQYQPSFVEARYLSLHLPLFWIAPGKLNFLSIGAGPSINYRSRIENDTFRVYGTAGSTKFYTYDFGYMYNTFYVGMMAQLEAVIYDKNRLKFSLFGNCNVFFNPFRPDYIGLGLRTSVKL